MGGIFTIFANDVWFVCNTCDCWIPYVGVVLYTEWS